MGEHPVVAECDPEGAHDEEAEQEGQVNPSDVGVPKEDDGRNNPEDGEPDQGQEDDLGQGSRCMGVADGTAQAFSFAYLSHWGKRSRKIYLNCYKFVPGRG